MNEVFTDGEDFFVNFGGATFGPFTKEDAEEFMDQRENPDRENSDTES